MSLSDCLSLRPSVCLSYSHSEGQSQQVPVLPVRTAVSELLLVGKLVRVEGDVEQLPTHKPGSCELQPRK